MVVFENLRREHSVITKADREALNGHPSMLIWFTGLSGSGKSTLSYALERFLFAQGLRSYVLDGDNLRQGLCRDLSFSREDRSENIRRVGEVSKLLVDAGVIAVCSFISPVRQDRDNIRELLGHENFVEIFCNCPIEICEARDVKGLYQKARQGLIPDFTGISSPYEEPANPALMLDTSVLSLDQCLDQILLLLRQKGMAV